MGCASSAHMVSATGDSPLKPTRVTTLNSIPTSEPVIKDLPDVVEKLLVALKENGSDIAHDHTQDVENIHAHNSTAEVDPNKTVNDSDGENSPQAIVQSFLADNVSINSKQSVREDIEQLCNVEENSPTRSTDADSLRTSSPETEIEEALANVNEQNPPTPKPTFSELQELAMLAIGTINNYAKPEDDSVSVVEENAKVLNTKVNNIYSKKEVDKSENHPPIVLNQPTEWERQADMLATTQKFNPIDAMRKLRKDTNNRSSSSLPRRGDLNLKPRTQRYFEDDLSEFFHMQSPLRSGLSSAKSERGMKPNPSEPNSNGRVSPMRSDLIKNMQDVRNVQDVKTMPPDKKPPDKKPPDSKRKESNLSVSQHGKAVPSPNLYKVRERCAVCCNKNKH